MAEKKPNASGAELTDEQLNDAAGGWGKIPEYDCKGGCGGHYYGVIPYTVGNQPYCANCYANYMKNQKSGDRERR